MDYRNFADYPRSGPRRVEGGIRARSQKGDIGESWWSKRFLRILESFDFGGRLHSGRYYARRGQVLDLKVAAGEVTARVQGTRARPYRVRIGLEVLSEEDWTRAEKAMSEKAIFAARLLAGEMPQQIEEAFSACKLSLFPDSAAALASACTCPDWANPCKHVAAVFYLLAEALDEDPFLAFAWRGRTKEELIQRLGALRGIETVEAHASDDPAEEPAAEARPLSASPAEFWSGASGLEDLGIKPWADQVPEALLRQLGPPPIGLGLHDMTSLLIPWYRTMARAAERRALGDAPTSRLR